MALFGRKMKDDVSTDVTTDVTVSKSAVMDVPILRGFPGHLSDVLGQGSEQDPLMPTKTGAPLPEPPISQPLPRQIQAFQPPASPVIKQKEFPPLFIKLTRYRQILGDIEYLRSGLEEVKGQMRMLDELANLQAKNLAMIRNNVENIGGMIGQLDAEFVRPAGSPPDSRQEEPAEGGDIDNLSDTISSLRVQIDSLKQDIEAAS
jgi:hypothetical protein